MASRVIKDDFKDESKVIGIHCTHGYNRTGFIIVSYLIKVRGVVLQQAVDIFQRCRPSGLYKKDYLEKLCELFHCEVVLKSPGNPEELWAFPDPESMPRFRITNEIPRDTSEVAEPGGRADPCFTEKVRQEVSRLCKDLDGYGEPGSFPGSQPVSLERHYIEKLIESGQRFLATYKSDGTRYLLLSSHGRNFLVDRKFSVREVRLTLVDRRGQPLQHSLFDGELVYEEGEETPYNFLIFDIIHLKAWNSDGLREIWALSLSVRSGATHFVGTRNSECHAQCNLD
jgi:mRNA-capping enzyme